MNPSGTKDRHEAKRASRATDRTGAEAPAGLDFIRQIVSEDLRAGKRAGRVHTRFPPEPNGYLHIGHAKSICLNFGVAAEFGGVCNLRFDDTNPETEELGYVTAIKDDVRWLGFEWGDREFYASDYFEQLYQYAVQLIKAGKAYVDSLKPDEVSAYRGGWNEPGKHSPDRNRSVEENLDLFTRMRAGEFEDGSLTLRAKIDMAASNMNMRDPTVYRIRRMPHYRTGHDWCIYPMYDFTHCLSDSIEGITHSLCTLEFEDHRPLYDWFLDELHVACHPQQIEFARLNLSYTVLSKRKLLELVDGKYVNGWDDPRMPTMVGLRRRGCAPEAIREFCDRIGVAKSNSLVDIALFEDSLRQDLNKRAPRVMAVLRPLRVVIENYPEDQIEDLDAVNNPEDPTMGSRTVPFSRVLYIEAEDFREDPPKKYFRLAPGARSPAALRLFHHVCRPREGSTDRSRRRAALHVRPGDARRVRPGRAKGQGDDPLGVGSPCHRGRGAAVRPSFFEGESGGCGRGYRLQGELESAVARDADGMPRRAESGRRLGRQPLSVRAAGLFLRRSRVDRRETGLQSDRRVA